MIRILALIPLLAACTPVAPVPDAASATPPAAGTVTYRCDGGKSLSVTYGRENGDDIIRIDPNGTGTEMLIAFPVERGVQYSWPSDGSHHIWTLDGTGTLSYRDGVAATTTAVRTNCKA